ncbi:BspA family leucine-rich repeat surface protein [Lactobacillus sp. W8089]|nr:BspA family leucine-rich repeat surface protein [Lactobacillus sp. W8086]MBI0108319.1 BspA family leucine-rich repeat surface protein [Lactobacillus sp. W8085]MBI0111537.1 BspA family leucine-rich repeat surface protein [Lactobacillus sp. W8088]MBI0115252.1 BspA family leucine-rich repeat surface protein [Lactobacillus sp. W8087]MBI0118977.1 BspA family leucine-rich repeat surface protein [Lactobacillus sp. W8089]MBI0130942.1 BspA family leucine-rich repeat surface protein [Lactobacillus sp
MQSRFNLRNTILTGFLILMELLGLLVIFVGFVKADTPLTNMSGVNSDPNAIIDADHAFSPTISSQTTVSVVSTNNCQEDTTISKPQEHDYKFTPSANSPKTMTVVMKYTNVGLDNNGNAIDATVTVTTTNVTDWVEIYEIGHVRLSSLKNSSSFSAKDMNAQVQINFTNKDQTTNKDQPAKVSGHLSFSNINNLKNLMLPLATANDPITTTGIKNISQIYCAPATSSTGGDVTHLVYSKDEKNINIIISDGIPNDNVKNTSKCIMFTAIFNSVSSLNYSFTGTSTSTNKYKQFDTGFTMGSIVDVAIPPINKKGIDERPDDKKQAGKQTALKAKSAFQIVPKAKFWQIPDLKKSITQRKFQETLQQKQIAAPDIKIADTTKQEDPFKIRPLYYLQQNLPQKSASYLSSYQIVDSLNDTWTIAPDATTEVNVINNIKVTDEQGNNRTSDFSAIYNPGINTQTKQKNTLIIEATADALKTADFYGHVYTFVISGSFAKDSEGRLVTKDNINNSDPTNISYAQNIPNTAEITYAKSTSDKDKTTYDSNTAYAYIAYPSERPDISVDSNTGIDLDNKTITGTIKDNLVHGQDSLYWDLTINYTNSSGVSESASLNLNNPSDSQHQNRVYKTDSTSFDSGVNFTAKLPDDIKMPNTQDEKDDYSKFTITATDRYGILGKHDYNLPWWTLDKDGLLTIYPHTIAPTGSVYESSWPWDSQRKNVKSIKILKSAPSTGNGAGVKVEGSLKHMFSDMSSLTSIEGLDNLQPVLSNQTLDFSYLFSGDSNLEKLDLSGLDMSNATWVSGMLKDVSSLSILSLSNKNKLLIKNSLDNEKPMLRSGSWQKFGQTGTEDDPTGDVFTTEKLLDLYSSDKYATAPNETYVWTDPDSPWWEVTNGVLKIHKHTIHRKPTKASDWPWSSYASEITEVDIDGDGVVKAQGSLAYMFSGLSKLTTIKGLSNLQTSDITSVAHLFDGCNALTKLDLPDNFVTQSVTDISHMFDGCTNLSAIQGLDKFNTSSVTSMSYLFYKCKSLKELDLPDNFVTQSVTDISYMFDGCEILSAIQGLDKFDTSSVTSMNSLFTGCHTLTKLDLPDNFVTQSVTDISHMFDGCTSLTDIIGLDKFVTSKVTNMSYMFRWDYVLQSLDLQSFDMSSVTDTTGMFTADNKLSELSLSKNTQFKGDPGLCDATASAPPYKYGDVHSKNWQAVSTGAVLSKQALIDKYTNNSSSFNPIKETYVWDKTWWTFDKDSGLLTIYPHDINVVPNNDFDKVKAATWPWDSQRDDVTSIQIIGNSDSSLGDNVQVEGSLKYMFSGMSKLTNVQGLNYLHPNPLLNSKLNNQKALDFSYLFEKDSSLNKLDLSGLDMSKATWVTNMFSYDNSLQKLTLSNKNRLQTSTPQKSNAALPSPNNENYTKNWQAKSSENEEDHYPTGKVYPAKDLENLYGDTNAPKGPTTYVWQPTGNLMFTQVPASLNYKVIRLPEFFTNSIKSSGNSSQTIKIQDSRAFRTGLKKSWNVQLTLIAKDLKGAQLHFSDDKTEYTGSGPYLIPAGNFTQKQDKYSWSTNDDGIQLDLQNLNYKNVENKSYNLEIDYNLTNSVN